MLRAGLSGKMAFEQDGNDEELSLRDSLRGLFLEWPRQPLTGPHSRGQTGSGAHSRQDWHPCLFYDPLNKIRTLTPAWGARWPQMSDHCLASTPGCSTQLTWAHHLPGLVPEMRTKARSKEGRCPCLPALSLTPAWGSIQAGPKRDPCTTGHYHRTPPVSPPPPPPPPAGLCLGQVSWALDGLDATIA